MSTIGVGLGQILLSVLLFGSMFVPLKKFNTGDGFFAQWIMNIAIMLTGFTVYASEGFDQFFPIAMLGGAVWSIGNMMALPIIQRLGLALGMLIWNSTNCLTGWAVSHFGLFGVKARPAPNLFLNYFGLVLISVGGALFSLIKNKTDESDPQSVKIDRLAYKNVPLNPESEPISDSTTKNTDVKFTNPSSSKVNISRDRALGIAMALLSGACYGLNLTPVLYVQDNADKFSGAPQKSMPYVFSHYFGAFLMSTLGFLIYCLLKKNHPHANNQLILPGFSSGIIWAIAQILLFLATNNLSASISYPIVATVPGCVSAIWSVFCFKEIQGKRNLTILFIAMGITLIGAAAIGMSKAGEEAGEESYRNTTIGY